MNDKLPRPKIADLGTNELVDEGGKRIKPTVGVNGDPLPGSEKKEVKPPMTPEKARALERRYRVAQMYIEGHPIDGIASVLAVPSTTVKKDLKVLRDEWREASMRAIDERKAIELAKLDHLEAVAWQAWYKSCEDNETTKESAEYARRNLKAGQRGARQGTHKLIPIKRVKEKTVKGQSGDPRFLDQIGWCIEQRLKVLGAYKEINVNVNNNVLNWADMYTRSTYDPVNDVIEQRISAVSNLLTDKSASESKGESEEGSTVDAEYAVVEEAGNGESSTRSVNSEGQGK